MGLRASKPRDAANNATTGTNQQQTPGGLRLTSKLLRKLEGASLSPSSSSQRRQQQQQQQQQQSVPSTSSSPTTQADHYFLQTKPELAQLLQKTAKYNEALLKHEQNEIDSLAKYIKEIEAAEKNPYEEEFTNEKLREARRKLETSSRKVKECFEEDRRDGEGSSLATRCRAVVLEYEKCGQEALEAFVAARS